MNNYYYYEKKKDTNKQKRIKCFVKLFKHIKNEKSILYIKL